MYRKTVLRNGIRVLTERLPYVHSVSTGIWVNVGSRDEREDERGITHFIEHMLFKGTQRRSALDIAKEFDSIGGFANAFTSKEHLCFHAKVLSTHLPIVVDVLTDIFLNSVFEPIEIEREQQVIQQEIRMIEDTPDEYVHILFQQEYWKNNPLGLPIYGAPQAVEKLDRDAMLNYVNRTFQPEQIIVSAAGNLDHDQFVELIGPTLEALDCSGNSSNRETPDNHYVTRVIQKDLEQVHVCLGLPGVSQTDPGRFPCHLLNVVLGSSMSSRLFQEIREKRGLAYSVYSFLNNHKDTGMLGIYAGISGDKVKETLQVIHEQLQLLSREPITEMELRSAKEYLKGSMYLNAENTDSRMNRLAKNEFLFERYVPFEEVEEQMNRVTPQDIQLWFRETCKTDEVALLLLGPTELDEEEARSILAGA